MMDREEDKREGRKRKREKLQSIKNEGERKFRRETWRKEVKKGEWEERRKLVGRDKERTDRRGKRIEREWDCGKEGRKRKREERKEVTKERK